jgi:23S rRNA (guanosine2251-2'-O)-methyltransferase
MEMSMRWLGGIHSVEETLQAKPQDVREVWIEHEAKHPAIGGIIKWAKASGVKVQFMSRKELDRAVAGGRHQGVAIKIVGEAAEVASGFTEYLNALSDEEKKGLVLVALDQIQDPHNLGAIARSAVNLGASGLIVPERRSSPISAIAVQSSAGAIQKTKIFRVVNLAQALERAKKAGFWIYGADAAGGSCWTASLNTPMILVIGSEGYGIRQLVREYCDELISIPQSAGGVESLNASCAASVLLYEIARQKAAAQAG